MITQFVKVQLAFTLIKPLLIMQLYVKFVMINHVSYLLLIFTFTILIQYLLQIVNKMPAHTIVIAYVYYFVIQWIYIYGNA